jgi:hypothetical protein
MSDPHPFLNIKGVADLLKAASEVLRRVISEERIPFIRRSSRCVRLSRNGHRLRLNALTQPVELISTKTRVEIREGLKVPLNREMQQGC